MRYSLSLTVLSVLTACTVSTSGPPVDAATLPVELTVRVESSTAGRLPREVVAVGSNAQILVSGEIHTGRSGYQIGPVLTGVGNQLDLVVEASPVDRVSGLGAPHNYLYQLRIRSLPSGSYWLRVSHDVVGELDGRQNGVFDGIVTVR